MAPMDDELEHILISGSLDKALRFQPVRGIAAKLQAAKNRPFHTFFVAPGQVQLAEEEGTPIPLEHLDASARFRVVEVESTGAITHTLRQDKRRDYGNLLEGFRPDDYRPELERCRHFTGRAWMRERLYRLCRDGRHSGYILVTAGPGVGKSAFVADLVRRDHKRDLAEWEINGANPKTQPVLPCAWHFFNDRHGTGNRWLDPTAFLPALEARVRLHYALPKAKEPPEEQSQNIDSLQRIHLLRDRLYRALEEAAEASDEPVLVCLDGLDELFTHLRREQHTWRFCDLFPQTLPEGVFCLLTSRWEEGLRDDLGLPELAEEIRIDGSDPQAWQANEEDLARYVRQRVEAIAQDPELDLDFTEDEHFQRRLVASAQGCFLALTLALDPVHPGRGNRAGKAAFRAELEAWRRGERALPTGLQGWIQQQWSRIEAQARGLRIPASVPATLLGLLACAREPLSEEQLRTLLAWREPLRLAGKVLAPPERIGTLRLDRLLDHLEEAMYLLRPFFRAEPDAEGNPRLAFFHQAMRRFAADRLDADAAARRDAHRLLGIASAQYTALEGPARGYGLRHAPAHLREGGLEDAAIALLTDFAFAMARLRHGADQPPWRGALGHMLADYPLSDWDHPELGPWVRLIHPHAHLLEQASEAVPAYRIFFQLAINHADNSPITRQAERYLAEGHVDWPWLQRVKRPKSPSPNPLRRTIFFNEPIQETDIWSDGQILLWTSHNLYRLTPDGDCEHIVQTDSDIVYAAALSHAKALFRERRGRFYHIEVDKDNPMPVPLQISDACKQIVLLRGTHGIVGFDTHNLYFWQPESSDSLIEHHHDDAIVGIAAGSRADTILFFTQNKLYLWRPFHQQYEFLAEYTDHITHVVLLPNNSRALVCTTTSLYVLDLASLAQIRIFMTSPKEEFFLFIPGVRNGKLWSSERLTVVIVTVNVDIYYTILFLSDDGVERKTFKNPYSIGANFLPLQDPTTGLISWSGSHFYIWTPELDHFRHAYQHPHANCIFGATVLPHCARVLSWSLNTAYLWDYNDALGALHAEDGEEADYWFAVPLPDRKEIILVMGHRISVLDPERPEKGQKYTHEELPDGVVPIPEIGGFVSWMRHCNYIYLWTPNRFRRLSRRKLKITYEPDLLTTAPLPGGEGIIYAYIHYKTNKITLILIAIDLHGRQVAGPVNIQLSDSDLYDLDITPASEGRILLGTRAGVYLVDLFLSTGQPVPANEIKILGADEIDEIEEEWGRFKFAYRHGPKGEATAGNTNFCVSYGRRIYIVRLEGARALHEFFAEHEDCIQGMAFMTGGRLLSWDGKRILVHDLSNGKLFASFPSPEGEFSGVSFDGRLVFLLGSRIVLWQPRLGKELLSLQQSPGG